MKLSVTTLLVALLVSVGSSLAHAGTPARFAKAAMKPKPGKAHATDRTHFGLEAQFGAGSPTGLFAMKPSVGFARFFSVEGSLGVNGGGVQFGAMLRGRLMLRGLGLSLGVGASVGNQVEDDKNWLGFGSDNRIDRDRVVWRNLEASLYLPAAGSNQLKVTVGHRVAVSAEDCYRVHTSSSWDTGDKTTEGSCNSSRWLPDDGTYVTVGYVWNLPL